jgi:hypothetical protein
VVGLDLHASAASVALLAASKLAIDVGDDKRKTRDHAFEDGNKCLTV